tara:strand:- start:6546 stop:6830 length:285 start_codon:yes stop_codon:yes gene_type:complete
MSINETLTNRKGRGINKSYYHYSVYNNENDTIEYYRTTKDIAEEFGCSRGTIYNIINNPTQPRRVYKNLVIEQDYKHYSVIDYIKEQQALINST